MLPVLDSTKPIFSQLCKTFGISEEVAGMLNDAWIPELLASGIEAAQTTFLTNLGELFFSTLEAAAISGITAAGVAHIHPQDLKLANEMAGHLGTRWMKSIPPVNLTLLIQDARRMGRGIAAWDFMEVIQSLVKPWEQIVAELGLYTAVPLVAAIPYGVGASPESEKPQQEELQEPQPAVEEKKSEGFR